MESRSLLPFEPARQEAAMNGAAPSATLSPVVRLGAGLFVRYAISVAFLLGLGLLVDWRKLGAAASALSWGALGIAGGALILQVAIGAWRANAFLRFAGAKADGLAMAQIYALSILANAFLLNFVAGAIARVALLRRHQVGASVSVATIVAEKIIITACLGMLAVVGLLLLPFSRDSLMPNYWHATALLAVGSVAMAAAAGTSMWWGRPILKRLKGWSRTTVEQCLKVLGLREAWLVGSAATLLSLLCAWCAYSVLADAVGIHNAGPRIALVLPVVSVVASLPISIGGWGVREFSFTALMLGFGVIGEQAILVPAIASLLAVVAALVVATVVSIMRRNVV
ncbi:MAG: flippase-like domain-containing protein [Rhodospirillaceae bacterium]|nr:flippase-like domain-containing protein [Rhodospirillaceae bacterium]